MNIALLNLGLTNCNRVFLLKKGIIAISEQRHIEIHIARADPTTSISSTSRKTDNKPIVAMFEPMLIAILVFIYPLIRR